MRDEKDFLTRMFTRGTPECAIACAVAGILAALLLLWGGIWRTLLVLALIAAGAFIGGVKDKKAFMRKLFGQSGRE